LYQLIYGHPPFSAYSSLYEKLAAIPNENVRINYPPIPLPTGVPSAVGEQLIDILQKCLVRDPKGRTTLPDLLAHPFAI